MDEKRMRILAKASQEVKQTPMETVQDLGGVFLNFVFAVLFFGGMIYIASRLA